MRGQYRRLGQPLRRRDRCRRHVEPPVARQLWQCGRRQPPARLDGGGPPRSERRCPLRPRPIRHTHRRADRPAYGTPNRRRRPFAIVRRACSSRSWTPHLHMPKYASPAPDRDRAILGSTIRSDRAGTLAMNNTGFWIIVGSPDNFERTRALGFTVQGLKSRHRKKAEMMKPGDKFAYYLTGRKAFAAIATVTSGYREEHDRIWASGDPARADEDYPFRLDIEPDVVLVPDEYIDAEPIARQMDYAS